MGKNRRPPTSQKDGATPNTPFNSSFSGLAGLRDRLPSAPETPEPPEPNTEPATDVPTELPTKVVVRRERAGRKGKTVTRISGVPAAHRTDWTLQLKRELGCGGAEENDDIILAGELTERAAQWLELQGIRKVVRGN